METVYADYAPKGVKFYYIYKTLAHPGNDGYVQPITLEERLMHVKEAQQKLGTQITWLCDSMTNDVKHALGGAPNSEFIIDPDGKLVVSRSWSSPRELRNDLANLVGAVENPTHVSDLKMKTKPPSKVAASGVVPRVETTGQMQALKIVPIKDDDSPLFYVKLRAEADSALITNGQGQLYVGFHLDPIHHVHWNNLAAPIEFEIETSDGTAVDPAKGVGPKVKEPSDIDPREFLVDVKRTGEGTGPLTLTVRYFACSDDEGWCKPVTQRYSIYFERDRDAGRTSNRGMSGRGAQGRAAQGRGAQGRGTPGQGAPERGGRGGR